MVTALLSDVNTAMVSGTGAVVGGVGLKIVGKFAWKGGPPDAGQPKGQDPAPPPEAG